jgi:hypothetical protein
LKAAAQIIPGTGTTGNNNPLSNAQKTISKDENKLTKKRDSVLTTTKKDFQEGRQKKLPKDSAAVHKQTLAALPNEKPDPIKLMPSLNHASCKGVTFIPAPVDSGSFPITKTLPPKAPAPPAPKHIPFLQVHGNVLYNLNYYSRIDTPYNETDIYQHTIQTWLDVLVKGQYPFRIFLTNHFSNSPLFRNYSDFNFGYSNSSFNQQIRNELRQEYLRSLPSQKYIDSLQRALNSDWQKIKGLEQAEKNPGLVQKMVESREMSMKKPASTDSSSPGGIKGDADELDSIYAQKRKDADSIRKEIDRIQQLLQTTRLQSQTEVSHTLADIQKMDNPAQVEKKLPGMGMSDSSLPKGYKTLMAIKSFNVGRTMVNYSELSAKNISVNGVQAEYNPDYYYAFAAGTVDYRFRDLVIQQPGQPRQYLDIFRFGKGQKNGNGVILTYFMGRRQLYNSATADTSTAQVPSSFLMGLTLEGNYHLTKNILFTGEIAKSSSPGYAGDTTKDNSAGSSLFRMGDHSNEAWSTKLSAFFPETQTRVRASYKHLAANYQSFSVFTDGSEQSAWSANVDQLLFKKQLDLTLGANTNDFSNPFIGTEYKSTTVFKSIQATFRRKDWPVISLGYFPSSQITKLGNGQYLENLFYTLVGNSTWSYRLHTLMMNTTLVYTQFYNRAADSGFTYFNTRNLLLSQSLFLTRFTFQVNASAASNEDYQLYTLEGKVQRTIGKNITVGAGVKYNRQTVYDIDELGYSAEAGLRLNKFGQIQFTAEKGYVPGMSKVLMPDNTGRLTYLKTF